MEFTGSNYARLRSVLPACAELSLPHLALLAGLDQLLKRDPRKIIAWAYYQPAFGLTPAKARRRVGEIEALGLLARHEVDFRKMGGHAGSRYQITPLGQRVISAISGFFEKAPAVVRARADADLGAAQNILAPTDQPPADWGLPAKRGVSPESLPAALQKTLARLPPQCRRFVCNALREGGEPSEAEARSAGVESPAEACRLIVAIRGSTHGPDAVSDLGGRVGPLPAASVTSGGRNDAGTRVPAADQAAVAAAAGQGGGVIPVVHAGQARDETALAVTRLAVAETAVRYNRLLGDQAVFRECLPQLVWSVTRGSLADGGPLLRRVRAALRLMVDGRWRCPRGYDMQFTDKWAAAVCLA